MTFDHDLKATVRTIPDYPKKGILFRDITPLLANPEAFRAAVFAMAAPYRELGLSAYDAAYVALAESLPAPLITRDHRLASAPGHHAKIELF